MRTLHLFAGAGGGLLADLILGHEPVCAVEWDGHACRVLRERSRDGWFPGLRVVEEDVRDFDFRPWAGVDQIAAGFPCQDISAAGRGAGIAGPRSGLVTEVFRAIDEIRPPLVFLENSPNIRTKGRREIIEQLVARGYSWRDGKIGASDVGAGHLRNRWFLLAANADGIWKLEQERRQQGKRQWVGDRAAVDANAIGEQLQAIRGLRTRQSDTEGCSEHASDDLCPRLEELWRDNPHGQRQEPAANRDGAHAADCLRQRLQVAIQRGGLFPTDADTIEAAARHVGSFDWSPPDAGVCRVVDGLAHRVDRIKCAGNGQVPIQAAAAWLMLSRP